MRLDHFRQRRDLLRGRLAELEQSIEAEHGAFGGKRASLEEVQAALPPDTALVGWVDVKTRNRGVSLHWACLVAAQGDPTWVRVPGSGPEGAGPSRMTGAPTSSAPPCSARAWSRVRSGARWPRRSPGSGWPRSCPGSADSAG